MKKLAVGILATLLAAGIIQLALQRQAQAPLRDEISRLHRQSRTIDRMRQENQHLAGFAVPPVELENLRNDQQELARRRAELVILKNRLQTPVRARTVNDTANAPLSKPLAPGMMPLENLANAGTGTPLAAAQTFFWAVAQVDPDVMVNQLVFSEASRAKAEKLLAALDDDTRAKMDTPEKLMALYLVGLLGRVSGVQVLGQEDQGADRAVWNVKLQMASGRLKDFSFPVQRSADGWREEIPAGMIDHWSYYLLRAK
jgi:type II secretory pathway pseudopilin PulG